MTSNPLHWSVLSRATLLVAIATGCFAASAQAQSIVDLQLVGPATPIIPGQIFDVKLRAAPQDPTLAASFVAIDCIVGWNPADVKFLSISTTGSTPLSSSYLPSPANDYTGVNEANPPADGNLLYYALTSLGNPRAVPAAGVQVVTFRFESVGLFTSTSISVIDNLTATYLTETIVYDGVVPGVDDFGIGYAATVTQLDCSTIFWYRDSDSDGAGDPSDSTTSCTQPAGYVSSSNDLCPTNAAMLAPTTYYTDADQDGFGAAGSPNTVCQTTAPAGSVTNSTDCNDALVMYNDSDADGYGTAIKVACNGANLNTDCNDAVAAINPGATEICDLANTDENCNGLADNADSGAADAGKSNFYADADSDTYTVAPATRFCDIVVGYRASVSASIDCNDAIAAINPGATEICDLANTDENCNGLADNADSGAADLGKTNFYADIDNDTYTLASATRFCDIVSSYLASVSASIDCNDNNASINPGATEICDASNVDENCNGFADNADSGAADAGKTNFYADIDNDTYTVAAATRFCDIVSGYLAAVSASIDCNDSKFLGGAIHPGAPEFCTDVGTDNNCNGITTDVDTNAPDQVYFHLDSDCDGYAGGFVIRACSPPSGCWSKWLFDDCDDFNPAIHPGAPELCADSFIDNNCDGLVNVDTNAADKIDFYRDQDLDTYSINVTAEFCPGTTNAGWIPTLSSPIDCNDLVAAIHPSAPELCNGIDDNCNGAIDETCQNVELALQILQQAFEPEGAFVVRVNAATPALVVELIAFQCGMRFDATRLELVEVVPVAGGPLATEVGEIVDNANGALRYAVGALAPASGMVSSASLFDIRFRVKPDADLCAQTVELVRFETIEGVSAVFVAIDQSAVVPSLVAAPTFDLDSIGPVFENVPSNIVRPTDAGSTFGAFIADPLVEATDACSEASVSLVIAFPDSTTASTWPTDSMFPIGITTIVWTAVDASGNPSTESRTIEVGAYQMLDASIELIGVFDTSLPEFARSIRLTVGSSTAVHQVGFVAPSSNSTSRVGLRANVQIAVAAALPCARAKDTRYSITDAVTVEINGTHYRARFQLKQGDSNNDDVIDIFDFGMWYIDLGAAASDHRSNFNADGFVNTADFGWIGLNFFARGETCGGLVAGPEPTARVSTKELRRRGLGALAAADINGDGWLDERDMRNAVESPVRPAAAPTASEFDVSW